MLTSAPLPPREGIGFYVWNLSRFLTNMGHDVEVITRGRAGRTQTEVVDGITVRRVTFFPGYPLHVHLHSAFVSAVLRDRARQADLFHLHSPLVRLPRTSVPALVTVHTPMKADTGAIRANTIHGLLIKLQAPISYRIEKQVLGRVCKVTAVATSVAQELAAYGVDPSEVRVLGNGVDTEVFFPGPEAANRDAPYFLTAGRLGARKGLEDLVECAAQVLALHPDHRFLIAGGGPLEHKLRAAIAGRKLESQIVLLGHISDRARMVELYRGATAYVHAAHYEGLPTVLLEAMACGRPVVATAVSGALDVVEHERNGLLVPPRQPDAMAQAVIRLVDEPDLAAELGLAARQTIMDRYSWQAVTRGYVREYEGLLGGARR
ncbi:MAG TPA: glycosyltransferase family 4 protein [Herpetosiphonaceae bacterium]|nr:glycosyltransferase family 4 protein [Herpetosiphonaceae bacterium]